MFVDTRLCEIWILMFLAQLSGTSAVNVCIIVFCLHILAYNAGHLYVELGLQHAS